MAVLVAYATKHTSTRGIAERIAARLLARGHEVALEPADQVGDVTPYEAVVLGSAVYYGRWLKPAARFVKRHRERLAERPVWLFSSGPLGDQPGVEPAQVRGFAGAIQPRDHRVFAGALDPGRLGPIERFVLRRVGAPAGDFRPWDEIDEWADGIAAAVMRRAGTAGTGR